jgi:imidazolonepropionase-like amidohydrolase
MGRSRDARPRNDQSSDGQCRRELVDLSDEVGTIASGKSADMIPVDRSRLDDVSVLEREAFVMARGDVNRA